MENAKGVRRDSWRKERPDVTVRMTILINVEHGQYANALSVICSVIATGVGNMSRVQLEQLTINGLREVARQCNIDIRGTRTALFDRLTDHYERNGWPEQISVAGLSTAEEKGAESESVSPKGGGAQASVSSNAVADTDSTRNRVGTGGRPENAAMNMHEIVQAMVQIMERNRADSVSGFDTGRSCI